MKRPRTALPKSARQTSTAVVHTRKEAAIHLVRVEFDMSRLQMGIDHARQRLARYVEELEQRRREQEILLKLLNR